MIIPLEKFWSAFERNPCDTQRKIVEREWPNGIPLCTETIQRARDLKLDLDWIAVYLPEKFWREYDKKHKPILHEYEEKRAPIWREYEEKCVLLLCEYNKECAPIWRECEEKTTLIRYEYDEKRALIYREYDEKRALYWYEYVEKRASILREYHKKCAPPLLEILCKLFSY